MLALLIAVTVFNALVATGFSLAGVLFPGFVVKDGEVSHTARIFALYSVARAVPLLLLVLWAAFRADAIALLWLGTLSGIIQLADAAVGAQMRDMLKIWGALVLGVLQLSVALLAYWFI
jgi:hypothetical protein